MGNFIDKDFMLGTDAARELYHTSAEGRPIIDYHCHLDPKAIAENRHFSGITQVWLGGDHYKWRAMRANGVDERYITGNAPDREKFEAWARTVPYTMRNPLYHWTHLELSRVFGIDKILKPETAGEIYGLCNEMLASDDFRPQAIMCRFGVEVVCTTDDPADSLEYHRRIAEAPFGVKVLPTWRPDNVMAIGDPARYKAYIERLSAAADTDIDSFRSLMDALRKRHGFFAALGCRLSDHGLDTFYAEDFTESGMENIFSRVIGGGTVSPDEEAVFKSGMLHLLAEMDAERGWTQQFHTGVIRNNNSAMFERIGPDAGFDSILDLPCAQAGNRFFDRLNRAGKLARTILYNLNPKDTEVLATMACNFNGDGIAGKMQLGSGWWFLDQEDGMRKQINALSSLGLLSRFVGMLTDSRSFLSYPRHEYFRRILCDVLGADIEAGKLPVSEMDFIHSVVSGISYANAKEYFGF